MQVLWLRYLTEIDEDTREVPKELLDNPEIGRAIEEVEESAFTEEELLGYDHFWDMLGASRLLMIGSIRRGMKEGMEKGMKEGMEKGMKEGMEKGMEKGLEKGRAEGMREMIARMRERGQSVSRISELTGIPENEVDDMIRNQER